VLHHYTIPELMLFAERASRRRLGEARLNAIAMRMASQASAKDWRRFMSAFNKPASRRSDEAPADALVRQLQESGLWRSLNR
jgi:hypothetical protein